LRPDGAQDFKRPRQSAKKRPWQSQERHQRDHLCREQGRGQKGRRNLRRRVLSAKWPNAVKEITEEKEQLLTFYDFLAEHWYHLRTTNPIESAFASVRARTDLTKGLGSRQAGLATIKLMEAAEGR
jgi:transposase-like protein